MNIIIREATNHDIDTLLKFEQGVISAERPFDETLKDDPVHYYDLPYMIEANHVHLVVAELNGELIASGYARIDEARHFVKHTHHAYLGFMYVKPEHRGKGIIGRIIEELKTWAVSKGIYELSLEVYFNNLSAIRSYEKMGFRKHMIEMRRGLDIKI